MEERKNRKELWGASSNRMGKAGFPEMLAIIMFGETLNRGRKSIKQSIWGRGEDSRQSARALLCLRSNNELGSGGTCL